MKQSILYYYRIATEYLVLLQEKPTDADIRGLQQQPLKQDVCIG
jgi:hypothetical protein